MSYAVLCTFDLKNANATDYQNAYADLENIGLKKVVVPTAGGKVVIPSTTVMGTYNGTDASSVVSDVKAKVKAAFTKRGFKSEIFLLAGDNWAWVGDAT